MTIKEAYQTITSFQTLTDITDRYQGLLEDDIADISKIRLQKQTAIENKINGVFNEHFIAVSTLRNKNNRQVHKYNGEVFFKELKTVNEKLNYFSKEDNFIFVDVEQKKYDTYEQVAAGRWFPNGSSMILDDILAKNSITNYPTTIMGPNIARVVKKLGFSNAKVFKFEDYSKVNVNAGIAKKTMTSVKDRVDDEILFSGIGEYDTPKYSANDILTKTELKNSVILIYRGINDICSADLLKIKGGPARRLYQIAPYLEDTYGKIKFFKIKYGDWKRLMKGEAHKKLNTLFEYGAKQGKKFFEKLIEDNSYVNVKDELGILSSKTICENILTEYYNNINIYQALPAEAFAKVKEFVDTLATVSKDDDSWQKRGRLNHIGYIARLSNIDVDITTASKDVEIDAAKKWPYLTMFSSYSYNIKPKVVLDIVATYKTL